MTTLRDSERRWLARQARDPFTIAARREGFRARAAYKLIHIAERHRLWEGAPPRIVDLGAAPGGWSQVAAQKAKDAKIIGVDIKPVDPVAGVAFLKHDVFAEDMADLIAEALGGKATLVLSDMAPAATGSRTTDRLRAEALSLAALDLAVLLLARDGCCLIKARQGADAPVMARMKPHFTRVSREKPPASRAGSAELYLLGLRFRPQAP